MTFVPYIIAILGFVGGFAAGLAVLAYIARGNDKKSLASDHDARLWLGLLGWAFALVGGWLGYMLGSYILYAYR